MVILGRYSEYVYAIFRIVFGFLIMLHGTQKLFGWPPAKQPGEVAGLLLIAAIIELVCGFLILIGFFSSLAAFLACGMFAVAYFMVHQPGGPLPIMNGGELAVAYCFVCLYISARGSGILSVDGMVRGSRAADT
ncbi:MAG TPA: DoxX family protein [Pyrinomonadaceae bacterium]|jgi:putative oxidoreductase|nr:DoxX family protein [Pyrinomonadaceae bacterium]